MTATTDETLPRPKRIEAIDLARGIALIAMAVFHFSWDLENFGYLEPGATSHGWLKFLARCTASSFLVLVGVSLYLAHKRGIRWRPFLIRLAMIVAAALAISVATWFAVRPRFIFFGILHEIALASLLGLAFLRLPAIVTLAAAVIVIGLPVFARSPFFDAPWFWWLGLSSADPLSNDYVPIFPWFGAVLIGIALAQLATTFGLTQRLGAIQLPKTWLLQFAGRHSLAFYLIHQPVLFGLVWLFAQVFPPAAETVEVRWRAACEAQCAEVVKDEEFCVRYCVCMLDEIGRHGTDGPLDQFASQCTARTEAEMGGQP